jgi:murein DD-endopeptidase MepM/ murein hydrolase activator NlpD
MHIRPLIHASMAALVALTMPMASAAISDTDASIRLAEANNLATQFQMPTSVIDTNNYGFRYSSLWNPSTLPATSHTLHSGIDLNTANDCGRQVLAVGNGIVRFTGHGGSSWGGIILIQHRYWDGTAQAYREVASLDSLREGDFVTAGQHIGYIADSTAGSCRSFSGVLNHALYRVAWSPHLHFEIRTNLAHSAARWATATTYQGLSNCTSILYASATCRLNATNAAGYTNPEDWIAAHANVVPPPPAAPVGLRATSVGPEWRDPGLDRQQQQRDRFQSRAQDRPHRHLEPRCHRTGQQHHLHRKVYLGGHHLLLPSESHQ